MNKAYLKQHSMIISMVAFTLIMYALGLFVVNDSMAWTIGILVGLVIAVLKLRVMEVTFKKAVAMAENKAKSYTQKHYMLRYLLTGLILVVAILTPGINTVGVFVGLLSMKIGAYTQLYIFNK
ncbi:MAG: ATP synthase subunit I [Cellulosilyticaceae bacterium]